MKLSCIFAYTFIETNMKTVILENTWLSGITSHGWGNGYVIIPEGHKLHGKHYEELNKRKAISVNGGLTYSELADARIIKQFGLSDEHLGSWIVGFDTCHCWDDMQRWPKDEVQKEADQLLSQLKSLK